MAPDDDNDRPFPQPDEGGGNPPEPEKGSPLPSDEELEALDEEIEAEESGEPDSVNDLAPDTNVEPGS